MAGLLARQNLKFLSTFALITVVTAATPVSQTVLPLECAHSNIIVVGTFHTSGVSNSAAEGMAHAGQSMIDVIEILKRSQPDIPLTIQVAKSDSGELQSGSQLSVIGLRVFFLARVDDEIYEEKYPSLPWLESGHLEGDPLKTITDGECAVIASKKSSVSEKLEAIRGLKKLGAPCIFPSLRGLVAQQLPVVSMRAERDLIERNDIELLPQVVDLVTSQPTADPHGVKAGLLSAIANGIKSPAAIPILDPLLSSPIVAQRWAAASALKNIGTPACVSRLKILLFDKSQDVRYVAATALADIMGEPAMHPSIPEFKEQESTYTNHWN